MRHGIAAAPLRSGRRRNNARSTPSPATINPDAISQAPAKRFEVEATSPILPPGPLSVPGIIRILLSEKAGDALAACGAEVFIVACKGTYPDAAGRWIICCMPAPLVIVNQACGVIVGTHRARRIKTPASGTAKPAAIVARARVSERGKFG